MGCAVPFHSAHPTPIRFLHGWVVLSEVVLESGRRTSEHRDEVGGKLSTRINHDPKLVLMTSQKQWMIVELTNLELLNVWFLYNMRSPCQFRHCSTGVHQRHIQGSINQEHCTD